MRIVVLGSGETVAFDPTDVAFAYGCGLFETVKLHDGRLCFWKAHWVRLQRSARALNLECQCDEAAVLAAIRELVGTEPAVNGIVKLSLVGDRLCIYMRPPLIDFESPLRLKVDINNRINERSRLVGHKTHNYMENFLLLQECRRQGYHDVLRANTCGSMAEATVGNVFFIREGRLCTPSDAAGILPGIVRAALLEMAYNEKMDVHVGIFDLEILKDAEAVFLTNASGGILPVFQVCHQNVLFEKDSGTHPTVERLAEMLAQTEKKNSIDL